MKTHYYRKHIATESTLLQKAYRCKKQIAMESTSLWKFLRKNLLL